MAIKIYSILKFLGENNKLCGSLESINDNPGKDLLYKNQKHINKMMSHINSTCRESLGGKCPYDIALTYMSAETLKSLGIKRIPPSEVNLTPSLLK